MKIKIKAPIILADLNAPNSVISLFAGVGGLDLGFEQAGFKTIIANDFDSFANQTYTVNHSAHLIPGEIQKIDETLLPTPEVLVFGFPCQAFSIAGKQLGFEDTRGTLVFEALRIIAYTKPPVILFENVKNLVSHDSGRTFKTILNALSSLGYHTKHAVLNAEDYGVPQHRERIFCVGFLDADRAAKFVFPAPTKEQCSVFDFIDRSIKQPDKYYYTNSQYFAQLDFNMSEPNTVYQLRRAYVRGLSRPNICPTLTANMGTGGHNVPLIRDDFGIRKFTPRECFQIMGFPADFNLPCSDAQSYKQAGNSVVVPIIKLIAEAILATK